MKTKVIVGLPDGSTHTEYCKDQATGFAYLSEAQSLGHSATLIEVKPRKRKIKCLIGSVSHGTMREEDLIPVFIDTVAHFSKRKAQVLRREFATLEQDDLSEFLNETLFNTLDQFAGPFFYFGSHPGDGSDYGFWLSENWEQDLIDDGGIKVACLSEVPRAFSGYVAQVSDHGNVSLYNYNRGRSCLLWEVV